MPAFCSLCGRDDLTEAHSTEDGRGFVVCLNPSHGEDGFVWEPSLDRAGTSHRSDGLGAELGIWEKLLNCFDPTEDYVSYGEIEDRFFVQYPVEASTLLDRYGHRWRDERHPAGRYSMSAYIALRMRELQKEKLLDLKWGPAEGPWSYNRTISYWRVAR